MGRPIEMAAIEQALASGQQRMVCLALEGEPGIGKTRLMLAVEEMARARGYVTIAATADEEIQGPFLIARSIFASADPLVDPSSQAGQAVHRVLAAFSNEEPGLESLSPDRKLLRLFDLAAVTIRTMAAQQPVALLIDDMQWADEDSLRLLRYVFRVAAASPIMLVLGMRANETAFVNEAVTLLADMDRMGILRRLRLGRFNQMESAEFLRQVLGGQINPAAAATMHSQAEGVPFVLLEQAFAYRDAGLIQQIDGVWTLARNADRLVPSAVQTLIRRRGAHLSDETKTALGEGAILGRSFSLRDLHELKLQLKEETQGVQSLAEVLAPAVAAGLIIQLPDTAAADYSFSHEQIRQHAIETLPPARRRAVHAALVELFTMAGDPPDESLGILSQHAIAAGQTEVAVRWTIRAAESALQSRAPEEVLRLVEQAHPIAFSSQDRVRMLCLRDDALDMLRRSSQRLEGLTEIAALADALGDADLEMQVQLRRAAALRLSEEYDQAADIARRVRQRAAEAGSKTIELTACMELGQDLLRCEVGEAYAQAPSDGDIDGAAEAYERAALLAEETGAEAELAAANRELGIIGISRIRIWFLQMWESGELDVFMQHLLAGERIEDLFPQTAIFPVALEAGARFQRALEVYENIGDKRGAMATLMGMAFLSWGPEIHLTGSVKRIEELHRMTMRLKSLTRESERALADAQMLFGAHVYAQAKVFPDMAITKGQEAYNAARTLGDRSLEFACAGGVALAYADIVDITEAERWLGRAALIAGEEPTALRARQLATWRGKVRAAVGDVAGMKEHFARAAQLAMEQGRPAERCEVQAALALEAARLGAQKQDEDLLGIAEKAAQDVLSLVPFLPGHPPWEAQARAALARVLLARGQTEEAAVAGRQALAELDGAKREDPFLTTLFPAAEAILAGGSQEETEGIEMRLQMLLPIVVQHIEDESVRVRWFQGPVGSELARLAGAPIESNLAESRASALPPEDLALLKLVSLGQSNSEIAQELEESEERVARRLAELYVKIGVSSRADAAAAALMGKLV